MSTVLNQRRFNPGNRLVFDTIRIGFPNADILVYGNGLEPDASWLIECYSRSVGAQYKRIPMHPHGQWIESILENERDPFWICDTDVVFFDPVEQWFKGSSDLFAGRYEPEFWEEWTETVHVARIHPSLVWFNPQPLRAAIRAYPGKHEFFGSVQTSLIQWSMVPRFGQDPLFYDTLAGLHHALGGTQFTEEQNKSYGHLFCGTYIDLISECHKNLKSRHEAVFDNPSLAKLLWDEQKKWYIRHRSKPQDAGPPWQLSGRWIQGTSAPPK